MGPPWRERPRNRPTMEGLTLEWGWGHHRGTDRGMAPPLRDQCGNGATLRDSSGKWVGSSQRDQPGDGVTTEGLTWSHDQGHREWEGDTWVCHLQVFFCLKKWQ